MFAHIIEPLAERPVALFAVLTSTAVATFGLWLVAQDHVVRHGGIKPRRLARTLAAAVALAALAVLTPAVADGQERPIPVGLPDLVSLAPRIWFDKVVTYDDGTIAKVMAFDGYLFNQGEGVLDMAGNPQEPDGVKQRYFDGEDWVEVAAPWVQYETDDGHNHFHLMNAAEYQLWTLGRSAMVGDSAKVGFCLVDTVQNRGDLEAMYHDLAFEYCRVDKPDSTDLRMGITPGWVDVYDANTTLQWVDISNIEPGRYWISSVIDPADQVVESDEENNGLVFSANQFPVSGWVPRPIEPQVAGEPIELSADAFGEVGQLTWSVIEAPDNGIIVVDGMPVPAGARFADSTLVYLPDAGFDGTDRFTIAAHDPNSPFPRDPQPVPIEVDASAYDRAAQPDGPDDAGGVDDAKTITFAGPLEASVFTEVSVASGPTEALSWLAAGLPAGVAIDRGTGLISGVPTVEGTGEATIYALFETGVASSSIPWTITRPDPEDRPDFDDINDFSIGLYDLVDRRIGSGVDGATYRSAGLPDGLAVISNLPQIVGNPTETGSFSVTVDAVVDDQVVDTVSFELTVRAGSIPAFPL